MRRLLTFLFVLAQVLALGWMAAEREYIVQFGKTVYLRTAPIDPRDVFRGDFVRLEYEISTVGARDLQGTLQDHLHKKGYRAYAVLKPATAGVAELDYATDVEPEGALFIRGRIPNRGYSGGRLPALRLRYGIEQLFVQQGKGKAIEVRRGQRDKLQVPLEVEVALGSGGTGVIKGHRWSRVGVQLAVLRVPERRRNANVEELEGPLSPALRVTLKNVSEAPLAVVNPDADCGFELVPVKWTHKQYHAVERGCTATRLEDQDVITLEPDEEYQVEIDLSHPRWHVDDGGRVGEIGRLAERDRFRFVYRSPQPAKLAELSNPERVWVGHLPTRAFNAFGQID